MFFLSFHGTFLCLDAERRLVHRPLADIADLADLLHLDIPANLGGGRMARMLADDQRTISVVLSAGALDGHVLHLAPDKRTASLTRDGVYYAVERDDPVLVCDRDSARGWETFVCVSAEDLADLRFLLGHDWIVGSTGTLVRAEAMRLAGHWALEIGTLAVDLRRNLPLLADARTSAPLPAHPLTLHVLIDGWRIERLHLFRPLICLGVLGADEIFEQALLCLHSLSTHGRFAGQFNLVTDRPAADFTARLPDLPSGQLMVQPAAASDWMGYISARYLLLEAQEAAGFQPVVILDADIVADADITPMLCAMVTAERITAVQEDWARLAHHVPGGATLIQRAGLVPRFARGFNAGTIGMPNLVAHGHMLRLIFAVIENLATADGRAAFPWIDQEAANYVSFAAGNFDTHTLLRYVRHGWPGCEYEPDQRLGLVHFWPPKDRQAKVDAMRIYLQTLAAADAARQGLLSKTPASGFGAP